MSFHSEQILLLLLLLLLLQIAQVDEEMIKTTNYLWSVHFAMATMTTVGYGDVSPTNTAELVYCSRSGIFDPGGIRYVGGRLVLGCIEADCSK